MKHYSSFVYMLTRFWRKSNSGTSKMAQISHAQAVDKTRLISSNFFSSCVIMCGAYPGHFRYHKDFFFYWTTVWNVANSYCYLFHFVRLIKRIHQQVQALTQKMRMFLQPIVLQRLYEFLRYTWRWQSIKDQYAKLKIYMLLGHNIILLPKVFHIG